MKRENNRFLHIAKKGTMVVASFRNTKKLTVLNAEALKLGLLDVITNRNTVLEINLAGIKFIDSSIIDILNFLSRVAQRFNSKVILTHVEGELMELIELVKLHSIFDIREVFAEVKHFDKVA